MLQAAQPASGRGERDAAQDGSSSIATSSPGAGLEWVGGGVNQVSPNHLVNSRAPVSAAGIDLRRLVGNLPVREDERRLNQVLGEEPDLHLVGTDHVTDEQVIGAVVPFLSRLPGHRS